MNLTEMKLIAERSRYTGFLAIFEPEDILMLIRVAQAAHTIIEEGTPRWGEAWPEWQELEELVGKIDNT